MSKANATQVGGTHYQNRFQHWDLVAKYHLGYFEGQVSKYITRHRSKNGKQDVEKALHFLDKMIEVAQVPFIPWWKVLVRETWYYPQHDNVPLWVLDRYAIMNKLGPDEYLVVGTMCGWQTTDSLLAARDYVRVILMRYCQTEAAQKEQDELVKMEVAYGLHDGQATGAYVNQDYQHGEAQRVHEKLHREANERRRYMETAAPGPGKNGNCNHCGKTPGEAAEFGCFCMGH